MLLSENVPRLAIADHVRLTHWRKISMMKMGKMCELQDTPCLKFTPQSQNRLKRICVFYH